MAAEHAGDRTIDHIVYATPDLDATVERLAGLMSLQAVPGGRHVGRGTHNALLGLGGRTYLEVIGPDPDQDLPAGTPLPFRLEQLDDAKLVWFAVATTELSATVERLRAAGFDPGAPTEMQRARPDGVLLQWVLSTHTDVPEGGALPFLIDWLDSPHPSGDTPQGCTLRELQITHPDPATVTRYLDVVGVSLPVTKGSPAGLVARIDTPNGVVELR